jgi:hypothetical protein
MDKKKIVNTDDSDVLNPMEGNNVTFTGDGIKPEPGNDAPADDKEPDTDGVVQDKPFPDELIDPEEQEDKDEMP